MIYILVTAENGSDLVEVKGGVTPFQPTQRFLTYVFLEKQICDSISCFLHLTKHLENILNIRRNTNVSSLHSMFATFIRNPLFYGRPVLR